MNSEPMPSSLAVLASPRCRQSAVASLDSTAVTSLSAANIQLMASQTGIEQLLSLAHLHVDNAMMAAQYIDNQHEAGGECGGYAVMPMEKQKTATATALPQTVLDAVRKLRRNARSKVGGNKAVAMLTAAEVGEARYERLKEGFTRLREHLESVAEHREQLLRGLDQLHASTTCVQEVFMDLIKAPPASSFSAFSSSLSVSCVAIEEMKNVLKNKVATQTRQKLTELETFETKLVEREQLRGEVDMAERQLQALRADYLKRGHHQVYKKRFAVTVDDIAVKRQEFQQLRRRLAVMTEALEHVFQFHFQLDQCIAEPELETVRSQVLLFFQQNRRAFDALLAHW